MTLPLRAFDCIRALLLLGAVFSQQAFATIVPLTAEARLSIPTAGPQSFSRMASDATGNSIVTYNSWSGGANSSFVQWYDPSGTFLGGYQYIGPTINDVTMNANGVAVVAFTALTSSNNNDIYIQIYDSARNPLFSGLARLNTFTTGHQINPSVAINDAGDIIAAWTSYQPGGVPNAQTAYARQFDSLGFFISAELQIPNPLGFPTQKDTLDTGIDANGNFVLAWTDWNHPQTNPMDVYARRYLRGGSANGSAFRVNTSATNMQRHPRVGMHQDTGEFAITWHSWDSTAWQLRFQLFSAAKVRIGADRRIDGSTTSNEPSGDIAMNSSGIVVVWGLATGGQDIYARTFNTDGTDRSPLTLLNTFTANAQEFASVTWLPNLEFAASWTSWNQDGDSTGIYGAHFLDQ
jgi:hypothetical protein